MVEASEQLTMLNEKLSIQQVAVKEKTEACESLLREISASTQQAEEKKKMAVEKGKEIEEQNKIIQVEKVDCFYVLFLISNMPDFLRGWNE